MSGHQQLWQQIVAIGDEMVSLLQPNTQLNDLSVDIEQASLPWSTITELEEQRLQLIRQYFESEDKADSEQLQAAAENLVQFDQQFREKIENLRQQTLQQFRLLGKSQQVIRAYQQNSR